MLRWEGVGQGGGADHKVWNPWGGQSTNEELIAHPPWSTVALFFLPKVGCALTPRQLHTCRCIIIFASPISFWCGSHPSPIGWPSYMAVFFRCCPPPSSAVWFFYTLQGGQHLDVRDTGLLTLLLTPPPLRGSLIKAPLTSSRIP